MKFYMFWHYLLKENHFVKNVFKERIQQRLPFTWQNCATEAATAAAAERRKGKVWAARQCGLRHSGRLSWVSLSEIEEYEFRVSLCLHLKRCDLCWFKDIKTWVWIFSGWISLADMAANIFEKLSEMFSSLKAEDGDDEEEEEEEEVSLWVPSYSGTKHS